MDAIKLTKKQLHVTLAVTFGSLLEWYGIYSYIYLTPILGKLFFNFDSVDSNLFLAFIIFGIGFIVRPVGGLVFGRWGDLKGRKAPFIWSIFLTTLATFSIGCLPTHASWGIWAAFALIFLRILQSFPESGEYVGAACFLYENANLQNRKFMSSLVAIGNQIGAIIAVFEALVLDQFMSEEFLFSWGWRISFWTGGAIGLCGVLLRRTLDETPVFKEIKARSEIHTEELIKYIGKLKKRIVIGTGFGIVNAATFYLIAAYLPTYWETHGLSSHINALISLSVLILTTILLSLFGVLGSIFSSRKLLIYSTILIILLLFPLYYSMSIKNLTLTFILIYLYVIPITCISALIPSEMLGLFDTPVRFSGVGMAFNLSDGVVGGFTPAAAILLARYTGDQGAFCWFIFLCAIVSLYYYLKVKD